MIELPKAHITLRLIKKWNVHDQNYFNSLDKRMLEYVLMYVMEYGNRRQETGTTPIHYKDLAVLAKVIRKCNNALELRR